MRIVIIGGVAGGATAAARLRRLNEENEIIILERSGYISYANCGLPYYIGGVIQDKSNLTLQTPKSFYDRFRIDVRVKNEATAIDRTNKTVSVKNLENGELYKLSYDKLILATGAKPVKPEAEDDKRIMTLRTVEDTYRMREYVKKERPKLAVIIGGGFIGLEMADNLLELGIKTTLLQRSSQVFPPVDYDMASMIHAYVRDKGLDLRLNTKVANLDIKEDNVSVFTENGSCIEADLVLYAIGVTPETELAKKAGLTLGTKEAVAVNEHMLTSDPDIYAVGDCVEIRHLVSGRLSVIPLAGPANKQGRIAADNICGIKSVYKGALSSSVIKLFDMTVASSGINEKTAAAAGIDYGKVITYSASHATYYPGATNMTIKTLYEKASGKIIGAQIVGFTGVDKRIDVLAAAIQAGMTAADLSELDLAYAPPYSSAKDPVNMAGFVIENIRSGLVKQHDWHDVKTLCEDSGAIQLDVRTEEEFKAGHIPGACNIPLNSLRERTAELDKSKRIYVNCYSGLRSYIACRILRQKGYDCSNLSGGYRFFEYVTTDRSYDSDPTHPCGVKISPQR